MSSGADHPGDPDIAKHLKRASGDLVKVISMVETERDCMAIAQQLQAVELALVAAKQTLVHEHLDHYLEEAPECQP